jgi:hypothetical protein
MSDNWRKLSELTYRGPRGSLIQGLPPMSEQERARLELEKSPGKRMQQVRNAQAQEKFEKDQLREENFQKTKRAQRKTKEMNDDIETLKAAGVNTMHILSVQRKHLSELDVMRKEHREGTFEDDPE